MPSEGSAKDGVDLRGVSGGLRSGKPVQIVKDRFTVRKDVIYRLGEARGPNYGPAMTYVYLIESASYQGQHYVGITDDLRQRFAHHNQGKSPHTRKYKPWHLVAYFAFADRLTAGAFEDYLKTGSGKAFLKKRFLRPPI